MMTQQLTLVPDISAPASSATPWNGLAVGKRARLSIASGAGTATMLAWSTAYAQNTGGGGALGGVGNGEGPTAMLDAICNFILGTFGQTLAVLGIIGIGLAWMFGRVSLGLIAGVIGGIIIMFGASYLAETLVGAGTTG